MGAELPLFIFSDNALGAPFGDVDDAFALTAIMKSGVPVAALASVFGNTFEPFVYKNHLRLAEECGFSGRIVRGAATWWTNRTEASDLLASFDSPIRVLCIGPMTDLALALRKNPSLELRIAEIIFVATNHRLPLPAWRVFDFNQWKDPAAMRAVFRSRIPLTCIPCDVARGLRVTLPEVGSLPGRLGEYLARNSARWFRRAARLKGVASVPLWDLSAAIFTLNPSLFERKQTTAEISRAGQAIYGGIGNREIQLVLSYDPQEVWAEFKRLQIASLCCPNVK